MYSTNNQAGDYYLDIWIRYTLFPFLWCSDDGDGCDVVIVKWRDSGDVIDEVTGGGGRRPVPRISPISPDLLL